MLMSRAAKGATRIIVELGYAEAAAYARYLRLVTLLAYEQHVQDDDEAHDNEMARQSAHDRRQRLASGCCPIHGLGNQARH